MCLRFQFCTHQRVCILYFLKKSQIRCTLAYSLLEKHSVCPLVGIGTPPPPSLKRVCPP